MPTNEFDPSVNIDYHEKYDNQSNLASTLVGGTVAAVTDFAASVWNSLPGTEEVSTSDMLKRIDQNALNVYNEHTDAVQAASFIGGMFVPTGLAMKGMGLARAGMKGVGWFSKAGREAQLAKVEELYRAGDVATKEYKQARNAYYATGLANQAIDAAAMEAALVGSMNAHPFMEDYMKDLPENFALGMAVGGGFGGVIGAVADRYALKNLIGGAEQVATNNVVKELINADKVNYNATQVQIHQANIDILKNITAPDAEYDALTKGVAGKMLTRYQKDQVEIFDNMLSPEVKAVLNDAKNADAKEALLRHFADSPATSNVEEIKYLNVPDETSTFKKVKDSLKDNPIFAKVETKNKAGEVTSVNLSEVVYFPEFNAYGTAKDIGHYTRARDQGKTLVQLEKELGKDPFGKPNYNIGEEFYSASSASLDSQYAAAMMRVDKMDAKELSKIVLHPDDLPLMNAVLARARKDEAALEALKDTKFTVTRNAPNYGVVEQAALKQGGVKANHIEELNKLTGNNPKYNLLMDDSLSASAKNLLSDWVDGSAMQKSRFRAAADRYLRKGSVVDGEASAAMGEILGSKNRYALINEMSKHADAEGNIYLWRGTNKGKTVGHSAVESYSTSYNVASRFGRPRLYKVHVNDVIGSVTRGTLEEREILVGSPARQAEATLPVQTASSFEFAKRATTTSNQASLTEISEMLVAKKEDLINSMLKQGVPFESIAIRTNTPVETVKAFALSGEGASLIDVSFNTGYREYTSAMNMESMFTADKRALRLKSNINKENYTGWKSGLDTHASATINREFTELALRTSDSMGARLVVDNLLGQWKPALDLLRTNVSQFVNGKLGHTFLTSMDHAMREMGEAGMIASNVGKSVQHIANRMEEIILKPLNDHMAKIATDKIALAEANHSIQLNASLKGYRIYKDRKFWQQVEVLEEGEKVQKLVPVEYAPGKIFTVANDKVDAFWQEAYSAGREMYNFKNVSNKILGKSDMSDIGLWVPSINPRNKFLAYVYDQRDNSAKLLYGNTADELQTAKTAFEATIPEHARQYVKVVTPDERELYNTIHARNDALSMEVANVDMQKKGMTAAANIKVTTDMFTELAGGYQHYIQAQTRNVAELAMSDTVDMLNRMSAVNQHLHANQPLTGVKKDIEGKARDAAAQIRNTLLGNSNVGEYVTWQKANAVFETGLSVGLSAVTKTWDKLVRPLGKTFLGGRKEITPETMAKVDYEAFAKQLEEAGVANPWAKFDEEAAKQFGLAHISDHKDLSKRLVYGSNAFAATVALRMGEVMQPIVNAMSLPILTGLAVANKMPVSFMGVQKATTKVGLGNVMYDGIRAMNDPKFEHLGKMWEKSGYFDSLVSEANNTVKLSRSFDKNLITAAEKALDSNFIKWASWGADKSETLVRRTTMYTGAMLAKRLYPELDDVGLTIFARDFMDRAVGNYHAAQRPVFFQGTAGVALGLFQTYMLTMAQNVYRAVELKNFKALGQAALLQTGIFGAGSLPGFQQTSQLIGEHFSDNHTDLTTGLYRALPDKMADLLMYGLPSNTGPAMYTRGEVNPRFPNILSTGVKDVAGINFAGQAYDMASHVIGSVGSDYPDMGRALGEALSMQSISRPIARISELFTRTSVDRKGQTMATPEEVWSFTGVTARLMSTRRFDEAKMRNMDHMRKVYEASDSENRQELMKEVRTAVRSGTLDDERLAIFAERYFRNGGNPSGWHSAYNKVLAKEQMGGKAMLASKLSPDSPLNFMIDNLDGEM